MVLRDSPFSDIKVPLAWTAALAVIVCGVIAVAMMIADRRETLEEQAYGQVRAAADAVQRPISGVLATPVRLTQTGASSIGDYFFAARQNSKLRAENAQLRIWRDRAIALEDINERYQALLGLKIEPPIDMVSGRSVTDSRGPFANSRLVNVGREAGVKVGNPVMSENGLVGRVVGVTAGASRVLLLTDIASRTPVMIDRTNARAILSGDGGPNPKLAYLRTREQPKVGDRVITSGDGGVMPRGLPVGVAVKGLDGAWRVQLSSDRSAIDFVRILKFEDFSQLANTAELSSPVDVTQMGGALREPIAVTTNAAPPPPPAAGPPAVLPNAAPPRPARVPPVKLAPAAPATPPPAAPRPAGQ